MAAMDTVRLGVEVCRGGSHGGPEGKQSGGPAGFGGPCAAGKIRGIAGRASRPAIGPEAAHVTAVRTRPTRPALEYIELPTGKRATSELMTRP